MSTMQWLTRTFLLPSYAEDLAYLFVALPTCPWIWQPQLNAQVGEFLDIEAIESTNGS